MIAKRDDTVERIIIIVMAVMTIFWIFLFMFFALI